MLYPDLPLQCPRHMNDSSASRNFRPKPSYKDRRTNAPKHRPVVKKKFSSASKPEGSETWLAPWVELKYFTYNPAVFPRMLGSISGDIAAGSLVNVYDKNGELFGAGFWNEQSRTPLRMIYHGKDVISEQTLDKALVNAVRLRQEILRLEESTNAYRVLHGDSDGIGGLIVDKYADVLSLEVSTLAVWQRLKRWLPMLHKLCGTRRHVIQVDEGIARMEGINRDEIPVPSESVRLVKILENGITYEVDFAQGHKTGFFCDQRDNRLKFASLVKGCKVLDLCCYSGGFSIAAKMLGEAESVTAVDLDEKAIAMAKRNANINHQRIEFVHADAFVYARQMIRNGRLFDAVLLDPPKFIIGRDGYDEGIKKYNDLNMLGLQCVRPGGIFVTCSCSGLLSPHDFEQAVIKAAQRQGRKLQILGMTGPGGDHPYLSTYPEGRYLKVLWAIAL